jgi:hypothetical protein
MGSQISLMRSRSGTVGAGGTYAYMSVEDERRAVTRKAAVGGLITISSLEVGALLWSLASIGCRNGILRVRDLVIYAVMSCAVIAQAAVVWVVVGRGEAANPAVRAVICLVVAVAVGLLAFVNFTSHGPWLIDAVAALSFSLFSMSVGILIASGIGRGYFALTRKSPSARRYEPRSHDCWGRNASPPHCENEVRMPPRSAPAVADVTSPFLTTAEAAELAATLREHARSGWRGSILGSRRGGCSRMTAAGFFGRTTCGCRSSTW